MNLEALFQKRAQAVERRLERLLPVSPPKADSSRGDSAEATDSPQAKKNGAAALHEAMRYAVLGGGKRIRPILAIEAARAVGGTDADTMDAACAIELIHSYSLVHDDLPCMDDDDERRGKPSCHKKYGEGTALLVGDALLTLAFRVMGGADPKTSAPALRRRLEALAWIADAAGVRGMVGGQAMDVDYKDREPDAATLEYIHTHKSGALIAVAARAGAHLGGGTAAQVDKLHAYGRAVGLLFQIVDDILDGEGYSRLVGAEAARRQAETLAEKAKRNLSGFGPRARTLGAIADTLVTRTR